jgi:hypothetical protein
MGFPVGQPLHHISLRQLHASVAQTPCLAQYRAKLQDDCLGGVSIGLYMCGMRMTNGTGKIYTTQRQMKL